ncbi:MAG: FixH family protein [Hyphomicrobiaceae bacterium]
MIMIAFFGTILSVNILMAVVASRSWTGLVVKNSYVASQKFNKELVAARNQDKLGWRDRVTYDGGRIELRLEDANRAPVVLKNVIAEIGRPAFEQQDQTIKLTRASDGQYVSNIRLAPGPWQIRIVADYDVGSYRIDKRFTVSTSPNSRSDGS